MRLNKTIIALMAATSLSVFAGDKPEISIFATGGTIAGTAKSNTNTVSYDAGKVGIQTLIDAVPEMKTFANVTGEQVVNVPSPDIMNDVLLKLSKRVNQKAAENESDGIVITHGTDTLEETAFFLDLTTKTEKPVVVVGAMRPSTAISADGPMNLLQAVSLASNPDSKNRGVLVSFNDRISSGFYVTKTNANVVDTFKAVEQGYLGQFSGVNPKFYFDATKVKNKPNFDVSALDTLPKVGIVYLHTEADLEIFDAIVNTGIKGLVVAGSGNGSLPNSLKPKVKALMEKGIPVVRSTRTGGGYVGYNENMGGIGAGFLNPQKARILLSLSLSKTQKISEIEEIFGTTK